jgi:hypothetical protein
MPLRDQPYLPLYIQDIMTDEKLNECSASTHGIYIKGIMCLMHKSEEYGKILLKQKFKQIESKHLAFASQLVKHLPYTIPEIEIAIDELISEKVCHYEGDYLVQKRMVHDNDVSEKRASAGKTGGKKSKNENFATDFAQAKSKANTEYEIEYDNVNESYLIPRMLAIFKIKNPSHFIDQKKDLPALGIIAKNSAKLLNKIYNPADELFVIDILSEYENLINFTSQDEFFRNYSPQQIANHYQNIIQTRTNGRSKINRGLAADASRPGTVREPM